MKKYWDENNIVGNRILDTKYLFIIQMVSMCYSVCVIYIVLLFVNIFLCLKDMKNQRAKINKFKPAWQFTIIIIIIFNTPGSKVYYHYPILW